MTYAHSIAFQLSIRLEQAAAALELLDSENTIPFIARYRKEVTGALDEEQIRQIAELAAKLRALDGRRATILRSIDEQGLLSPELRQNLLEAASLTALEDLYQPYKPKRRTRASVARERGLGPLAELILLQERTRQSTAELAAPYLKDEVPTAEAAWAGAADIVAETISDHPEVRRVTREKALQFGAASSAKTDEADDPRLVYSQYYEFEFRVDKLRPHQVLALNRGEAEKVLRVKVAVPERDWQNAIAAVFRPDPRSPLSSLLQAAAADAAERLLLPAIERDVRRELTEKAEIHAMGVFAANLRGLLNQPPLTDCTVLGLDPGFRTGCKVAVVDPTGKVLETETIYPHEPQKQRAEALKTLARLVTRHKVSVIAIGNGTASRETEQLAADLIGAFANYTLQVAAGSGTGESKAKTAHEQLRPPQYLIVSEAGASVYSASPLARAELPDLDVTLRGAVSIARRVQDPLAELVKIDPQSIGVGMYQHDVDQKRLADTLAGVVESVVNAVGVDANTASPALLTYVAGIGPKLAERIVAQRDANGPFKNRQALRKVPGLGPKAFEQAAGFLRIRAGDNPLDASAIHPESYPAAEALLKKVGLAGKGQGGAVKAALEAALQALLARQLLPQLAAEMGVGVPTLTDILEQLARPGRDPRQDLPAPILRADVLALEDLKTGLRLKGTVRNVVDFGAFVDIGVKESGLLHRSQLPRGTVLQVGEVIEVEVLKVEIERGRIGLGWVSKK